MTEKKIQNSCEGSPEEKIEEKYVWQYIDAHGHFQTDWEEAVINGTEPWKDYTSEMSEEIEKEYLSGKESYSFSFGQSSFRIDLKNVCKYCKCLKQITTKAKNNAKCGYKRRCRRIAVSKKGEKDPFPVLTKDVPKELLERVKEKTNI